MGKKKSRTMEDGNRIVGEFGFEGSAQNLEHPRNSMKTIKLSLLTKGCIAKQQKARTSTSHTIWKTSTDIASSWASHGNKQKVCNLGWRSCSLVFSGTLRNALWGCWQQNRRNTLMQLRSGYNCKGTTLRRHRSSMGNYSTSAISSQRAGLTSPIWKPS